MLILFVLDIIIIPNDKSPLLGAIGIIISAFIASFSVKKSIDNTNKIEKTKRINEKTEIKYYIDTEIFRFFLLISPIVNAYKKNKKLFNNEYGEISLEHFKKIYDAFQETHKNIYSKEIIAKVDYETQQEINQIFDLFIRLETIQNLSNDKIFHSKEMKEKILNEFSNLIDVLSDMEHILQNDGRKVNDLNN